MPTPVAIIRAATAHLEELGYDVTFEPGWEARSTGSLPALDPQGLVCHHTATNRYAAGDYPSLRLVRDGRSDLSGPLAQFGLGRSGRIYVIAAGKANHAGGGGWNGLAGNYTVWGIEAENDGIGEPWPAEQVDAYLALATALARFTGFGAEMVCRHAEWSDGGKIDTATAPMNDGDWIRAQVAARLAGQPTPTPPDPEEEDMASPYTLFNWGGAVWAWSGGDPLPLNSWPQVEPYLAQGAVTIGDLTDDQFRSIAPTWTGRHPAAALDQERAMAAVRPAGPMGCAGGD